MKKYITQAGFDRLREEFRRLLYEERPRVTHEVTVAAAHGDRSENYEYKLGKKKLREIDGRIHRLQKQLESYLSRMEGVLDRKREERQVRSLLTNYIKFVTGMQLIRRLGQQDRFQLLLQGGRDRHEVR